VPAGTPTYDANGNLTYDGFHHYTWDADGNSISIDGGNLTFDALDRMAEGIGGGTQYVYGPDGSKLALMNGQTLSRGRVPLPAGGVAVYTSGPSLVRYWHPDWLGSIRPGSNPNQTISYDGAYAPYGEQYAGTGNADFTGQVADTETDMYDFLYREYHYIQGRWISPDPAGLAAADPTNPQTWNRYAYVGNNPLALTDPMGLDDQENCYAAYNANNIDCNTPCDITMVTCNCDPEIGPCWRAGGGGGWPGGGGAGPGGNPSTTHVPGGPNNAPLPGNAGFPSSPTFEICMTIEWNQCWDVPWWWAGVGTIGSPVAAIVLAPMSSGALNAAKQIAKGMPTETPNPPLTPAPDPIQNIDKLTPENFEPASRLARLLKVLLDLRSNIDFPTIPGGAPSPVLVPIVSPCLMPGFQGTPMCGGQLSGGL
jgi:RHS repeat-associated protein